MPDHRHADWQFEPGDRPETEAARHMASALGWPFVDLESYAISCGVLKRVPAELACWARCVPMVANPRRLVVAVDDAFQGLYLAAHPEYFGYPRRQRVEVAFATRRGIDCALHRRLTLVQG